MKTYYFTVALLILPALTIAQDTVTKKIALKGVEVRSKRPLIEMELDKTVVNVGAMISSAGSNTLEVLERTPGVTVNINGDITLNGRGGVLVLIDGRSTYLSAQDLANYLKSIPGASLDKIELMDNPPARYDAGGNAIINIRMKRTRVGGFTGNLATGLSQGQYTRGTHSLNVNYNYKKINLFSNLGYNHDKNYTTNDYQTNFQDTTKILLHNRQVSLGQNFTIITGLDYLASQNTTIGVQVNLTKGYSTGEFFSSGENYFKNRLDSTSRGYTSNKGNRTNLALNMNFLHRFGKNGRELSADINYMENKDNGDQTLTNQRFLPDNLLTAHEHFLYDLPSYMKIYSFKTDYVHPFGDKAKIEAGLKSSYTQNDNLAAYYLLSDQQPIIDNTRSNHFKYREHINAAYFMAQRTGKRLGIQLGLRMEQTVAHGDQLGNADVKGSSFDKDYAQLFPTLAFNYKLDTLKKNTLGLSINRRLGRPNYQLLNPFIFFRDQYTYTSGNPYLTPQFQYRYELRFQHKQWLRMTLSYNDFRDVIFTTTNVVGKTLTTQPQNVSNGYMLLLNTGLSLTPASWWYFNSDILLSYMGLDGQSYGEKLDLSTYVLRLNVLNQFQLGKDWSAELSGYFASVDLNGQTYTDPRFRVNAGIQKKIWKKKGSIRIYADDIFHTWVSHNRSFALKQTTYLNRIETDTQRFGVAFTYSFGKDTFKRKSRHTDNALDEEKGRM